MVKLYKRYFVNKVKNKINDNQTKINYKNNDCDFTRNRKMSFQNVVSYNLNKKGLTSKMEIEEFTEQVNMMYISFPAVLKQKLKLNGEIFMERMTIKEFKDQSNIEIIESIMKMNNGYVTSKELSNLGIHRMYLNIMKKKV